MNKLLNGIVIFFVLIAAFFYLPQNKTLARNVQNEKLRVIYFYSVDCVKCQRVKPFIEEIKKKYENKIEFIFYDVKEKEECRQLLYHFVETYKVPEEKADTPIIFMGKDYLAGPNEIEKDLEEKINQKITNNENLLFDCHDYLAKWPNVDKIDFQGEICGVNSESCKIENGDSHKKISLALIIVTAAIDSINPCAIAVLIFLITTLIALKSTRNRMLKIGFFYIGTVFATYYLAGLGLMRIITNFNIAKEIGIIAGIIVLLAGFLEIKEGYYPNGKQLLRIPEKTKPIFTKFLKKGTIPSVVIAGVLVSAFELPCTGQVYLAILSMLSKEELKGQGYSYLLIYNLIFVLPLVIILFIAAWGFDIKRMDSMRKETRKTVKILMGIIMLVLGIFLFYQDKVLRMLGY